MCLKCWIWFEKWTKYINHTSGQALCPGVVSKHKTNSVAFLKTFYFILLYFGHFWGGLTSFLVYFYFCLSGWCCVHFLLSVCFSLYAYIRESVYVLERGGKKQKKREMRTPNIPEGGKHWQGWAWRGSPCENRTEITSHPDSVGRILEGNGLGLMGCQEHVLCGTLGWVKPKERHLC